MVDWFPRYGFCDFGQYYTNIHQLLRQTFASIISQRFESRIVYLPGVLPIYLISRCLATVFVNLTQNSLQFLKRSIAAGPTTQLCHSIFHQSA